ncbi:hypothetical protein D9M70_423450 [compost metagenome]
MSGVLALHLSWCLECMCCTPVCNGDLPRLIFRHRSTEDLPWKETCQMVRPTLWAIISATTFALCWLLPACSAKTALQAEYQGLAFCRLG